MTARHAYLITAYDDFWTLDRLVEALADPRNDIFLHVDRRAGSFDAREFLARHEGARLVLAPRMRVYWGDFTQVASVLRLLRLAMRSGDYEYFHLLSGSDLPLKSQDRLHQFFADNRGKEFVAFNELGPGPGGEDWVKLAHPLNRLYRAENRYLRAVYRRVRRVVLGAQRAAGVDRRRRVAGEVMYGSDWFSITRDLAATLLESEPALRRGFGQAFVPTEFYVQTTLWNSSLKENIFDLDDPYRSSMRYVDFARSSSGSPAVLTTEDFDSLMASDRMFARKFDSRVDRQVIELVLDRVSKRGTRAEQAGEPR